MRLAKEILFGFVFLSVFAILPGCAHQDISPPPIDNTQSRIEAIKRQSALFSKAYVDNDLDALMSIYAADAVIAPPRRSFLSTPDDLRAYWKRGNGVVVTQHKTIPEDIVVHNNIAYDWGRYEGASGPVGAPSSFAGKYLLVWRKDEDGAWRIVQDMWNSLPK